MEILRDISHQMHIIYIYITCNGDVGYYESAVTSLAMGNKDMYNIYWRYNGYMMNTYNIS